MKAQDYHHVRQHGLTVDSPNGDFRLPDVQAYSTSRVAEMPRCDMVVMALKTTQNASLQRWLPTLLKPDGVVLVLQNGLGMEADIARMVGSDRAIGGICFICSTKITPGHIRHAEYDLVTLAEYSPTYQARAISDRVHPIGSEFEALIGNPLRVARTVEIFVPQIAMLYQQLKFFDAYDRVPVLAG